MMVPQGSLSLSFSPWLSHSCGNLSMTPRFPDSGPIVHTLLFDCLPVTPTRCPKGASTLVGPTTELTSSPATFFTSLMSFLCLVHYIIIYCYPSYKWKPERRYFTPFFHISYSTDVHILLMGSTSEISPKSSPFLSSTSALVLLCSCQDCVKA